MKRLTTDGDSLIDAWSASLGVGDTPSSFFSSSAAGQNDYIQQINAVADALASAVLNNALHASSVAPPPVPTVAQAAQASDSGSSIQSLAYSSGYNPATDRAQSNINTLFGGAAKNGALAKATLDQFHGQGISVGIFDDGIDKTQTKIMGAYDASKEIAGYDPASGAIKTNTHTGDHGTSVAGIIATDASLTNGSLTGLAYGAKITAINVFDYSLAPELAYTKNFDVTNNSWGWVTAWCDSANSTVGKAELNSYQTATATGRGGLGTTIVASAGNSWLASRQQTGNNEMNSSHQVIDVGATLVTGEITTYSNRGSNLLLSAPTNIATVDRTGAAGYTATDYNVSFTGTSAAAPEVTSVVADMLSANKLLGWRDIQKILAITAEDSQVAAATKFTTSATGSMAYGWTVNHATLDTVNGGGLHFSNDYGFGQMDAHGAVREAEVWNYFSKTPQTSSNEVDVHAVNPSTTSLSGGKVSTFSFNVTSNEEVENATLTLNYTTKNMNGLKIELISPNGTNSIVLDTSTGQTTAAGNFTWSLNSHAFLGETALGTWTTKITDTTAGDVGKVTNATLDLYGSAIGTQHVFHYTDDVGKMEAYDATRLTIHDKTGVGDWLDTAAMSAGNLNINLTTGATSTANGKAFVIIGTDTTINNATAGDGLVILTGNANANILVGGHGTDTLNGGAGNDILIAGYGTTTMNGGAGSDVFTFNHTSFGFGTISDFVSGVDKIELAGVAKSASALSFKDTAAGLQVTADAMGDNILLVGLHSVKATDFLFT